MNEKTQRTSQNTDHKALLLINLQDREHQKDSDSLFLTRG